MREWMTFIEQFILLILLLCSLCVYGVRAHGVTWCHCPQVALSSSLSGARCPSPPSPTPRCAWTQIASDLSFPLSLSLPKSVLSEEAAWWKNKSPDIFFFFLKNTIRTKAMINTRNWNKWQLTAENHLPAVGGRKLLTAGPHWVASKREELAGAGGNTHRHPTSLQGCALGQRCPVGSVSYVSFTIKW